MQVETITAIVSAISTLVVALGGGSLLYHKQNKIAKKIENESSQSAEWRKLYDEMKGELQNKDSKIDEFYKERKKYDADIADLRKRITDLEIMLKGERIYRCELMDCKNRKPPMFITTISENAK
jgi:uncharacterized coiled-coil DUF342 family protein